MSQYPGTRELTDAEAEGVMSGRKLERMMTSLWPQPLQPRGYKASQGCREVDTGYFRPERKGGEESDSVVNSAESREH
ncbi:hypothetical protein E2C01_090609 [Portunus trituberculatus]|uniref:Uncharacterized protein n=1 Tax=Portunus trituberculatus TaxID=210409 RepID=A0A5B7JF61_PORTR|nr:hypothetical protein [Portunus trituberculatus]